jgi:hypothetical protein
MVSDGSRGTEKYYGGDNDNVSTERRTGKTMDVRSGGCPGRRTELQKRFRGMV